VGVGADGAACSNHLDCLQEVRLAALLLATSEGARALGLEDEIDTIETGKLADLLVLSAEHPETWTAPQADPHDRIAFGASRAAVRHVLVAGRLLVEDGRLLDLDLEEI
jgi:5-methylthioadenosine/S-adenosylhomocysteine deaminase